ncbi:MAG TPA: Ig-like domain-containing protein, partial [Paraburkholderia sp.]
MSSKKLTLVANSNGVVETKSLVSDGRSPVTVKVHPHVKYLLVDENGQIAPENVTLTRAGDDLQITLEGDSSPSLVLEGYYAQPDSDDPAGLYGIAENGQLYAYTPTDGVDGIYSLANGMSTPAALGGDPLGAGAPYLVGSSSTSDDWGLAALPLFLFGGAAAAMGVVAATSGGSDAPAAAPAALKQAETISSMEVIDRVGPTQGILTPGEATDDPMPVFVGTGVAGSTVTIYDGATVLGTTTVDDNGNWIFAPSSPLADGEHSLTATQTTPGTLESEPGASFTVIVDTVPPDAPHIGSVVDNVAPVVGELVSGQSTNDPQPTFSGTAEPGSTINVYDNGELIGSTTVADDGTWTFQPDQPLDEGQHLIQLSATDEAGNTGSTTGFEVDVDTAAPAKPGVGDGEGLGAVIDDVGPITGPIPENGTTDDPRPEFTGTGTPGDTITVYSDGTALGTALIGNDGKWSFTPSTDLSEGNQSITITETDPAGNESEPSDPFVFSTDYTPPDASKLSITGVNDAVGEITGNVASGGTTDDSRPVISGTGTAGDTIIVSVTDVTGAHEVGRATVGDDGTWSLEPPTPLASGANEFTAVEQDPAGNRTDPSDPYAITLDMAKPAQPAIDSVLDDTGSITGFLQKGAVTDDTQPTVSGSAHAGSTVKLYDGSTLTGSATADASGNWTITPDTPL